MDKEYQQLAAIINTLGTGHDLLDLVDYLSDLLFIEDEKKRMFREACLYF